MQSQKINWPAALLLAVFGFGALLLWGTSLGLSLPALAALPAQNNETALALLIAATTGFMGSLLLIAGIFTFLKIIGSEAAERPARLPFTNWHIPALILLAAAAILAGNSLKENFVERSLLLPIFTLTATVSPLWLFLGIGTRRMELGPRWRVWGIFGLAMTLGPLVIMLFEAALFLALLTGAAFYVLLHPELTKAITGLAAQAQSLPDPEQALKLFSPYLLKPATMVTMYAYACLMIPMIEELFKPIGVWFFARQLKTPGAGFAMGILSGTAYALLENLGAIAQFSADWNIIAPVRAATSLLHVTTTGLMGWAIVYALNERKYGGFLLSYSMAVSLHGLWNAAAVTLALYSVIEALGKGKFYEWLGISGALVIGMMSIALLIILIASNHAAKSSPLAGDR
jgi:hypothetical protein